jgi:hypothetical protein
MLTFNQFVCAFKRKHGSRTMARKSKPTYKPWDKVQVRGSHPKSDWVDAVIRSGDDERGYIVDYPSHDVTGGASHPLKYIRKKVTK